jgi:general secretion pathway protein G
MSHPLHRIPPPNSKPLMKRSPRTTRLFLDRSGFTLIEIMMVVMIIGLLAGLAAYNMGDNIGIAKDTKVSSDLKAIETQLMMYETKNGFLPSTDQGLAAMVSPPNSGPTPRNWSKLMKEVPVDPWGMEYQYVNPGRKNTDSYDLFSAGKDRIAGTADDIGNWKK